MRTLGAFGLGTHLFVLKHPRILALFHTSTSSDTGWIWATEPCGWIMQFDKIWRMLETLSPI